MTVKSNPMADEKFNPAYDTQIYQKFDKNTIENKIKNKEAFCEETGLPFDKRIPLMGITFPLTDKNNLSMLQDIMNGILEQPVQMVLTSIGTEKYQSFFTGLAENNSNKIALVENSDAEKRKIYAAADILLAPADSEECVEEALRAMGYGVVPISPLLDFTEDYNPNKERGNAFVYLKNSPWSFFANIIRSMETFRFPYDWRNIQVSAMEVRQTS